jgi:hypothetical protein
LPPFAVALLEQHQKEQLKARETAGDDWQDGDLVFATPTGTPLDHSNVTKAFKALLTSLNLPAMRLHDLRHTCASILVGQGVHLKVIQDVLGHSQITLTADTYSHVAPAQRREAAATMEAVLVPPDPPTSTDVVVSEVVKIDADTAPAEESIDFLNDLVSPVGIEPTTNRLRVGQRASADVHQFIFWCILTKSLFGKDR